MVRVDFGNGEHGHLGCVSYQGADGWAMSFQLDGDAEAVIGKLSGAARERDE